MKKVLLTLTLAGFAASVLAQGTVNFANNVTGTLRAPVYGPEAADNTVSKIGNTTAGLPAGTMTYTGPLLNSSLFRAQLFSGAAGSTDASALVASPTIATFRSGSAAGLFLAGAATLANVAADAPAAALQLRAWDNTSGQYATWALAEVAWRNGLIAAGMSTIFNVNSIGGAVNNPPNLTGLTSFNIYYIPEPSTFALAGLGAAALMIFRRRN